MPIQVVATYKKIPPPPVDLITAGDDVFPLCNLTIFLEAIVDPILNIQGHTIDWIQLTGTSVILIDADTLTPSYLQIVNDETDKEFEVIIDKDLPEEQRDRVIVYATPTSLCSGVFPVPQTFNRTPSDAVECSSITVSTSAQVPPPAGVHNDNVTVTDVFAVSWDLPPDPILQPYVVDMIVNENGIPVGTYLPSDILTYLGGPNKYSILTNFVVRGNPSSEESCTQDFSQTVVPSTRAIDDMIDAFAFPAETKINSFPNIVQYVTDGVEDTILALGDTIVYRYINITQDLTDSIPAASFTPGETIIVRTDEGGIGGG